MTILINEPNWQTVGSIAGLLEPPLFSWLTSIDSMTERLRGLVPGFAVEVLQHEWHVPRPSEAEFLGIEANTRAIVREVLLHGGHQPFMYARSVFPENVVAAVPDLLNLGARPLGEILFSQHAKRSGFEFAEIGPENHDYIAAMANVPTPASRLWARRSAFSFASGSILVFEVFLPALVAAIHA